jgi:hypothetical protein
LIIAKVETRSYRLHIILQYDKVRNEDGYYHP